MLNIEEIYTTSISYVALSLYVHVLIHRWDCKTIEFLMNITKSAFKTIYDTGINRLMKNVSGNQLLAFQKNCNEILSLHYRHNQDVTRHVAV